MPRCAGVRRGLTCAGAVPQFREKLTGGKYIPKDLRFKKTRAMRRALTATEVRPTSAHRAWRAAPHSPVPVAVSARAQRSRKTEKQRKKESYFPLRRYAVKA